MTTRQQCDDDPVIFARPYRRAVIFCTAAPRFPKVRPPPVVDGPPAMRLLHIEDDAAFAAQVRRRLQAEGITVDRAGNLKEAAALWRSNEYAAVVLDLMLPDGSGLELLQRLREAHDRVPVMVVSGLGSEQAVIVALNAGADDYVLKPVSLDLLRARLHALVRRGGARTSGVLRVGTLVVNVAARTAHAADNPLALSTVEFNLLARLATTPDQVLDRTVLLAEVWGYDPDVAACSNVVDVTVGRLRRRLGEVPGLPTIESVRGAGYVLRAGNGDGAR